MKKLIPKIIFWLMELLAIWLIINTVRTYNYSEEFLSSVFNAISTAYMISVPTNLILWIFNFLTEFDDYDGFFEGLKALIISPATLVYKALCHLAFILGYIYASIVPVKKDESYTSEKVTPTRVTGGDEQKTINFQELEKIMKKAVYNIRPKSTGYGVGIKWEMGYLECSYFFFTFTFKGTIVSYYEELLPLSQFEVSECIRKTKDEIESVANQVISKYYPEGIGRIKYKFDIFHKAYKTN